MAGKPFYLVREDTRIFCVIPYPECLGRQVVRYSGFMFQIFDFIQILAPWSEKVSHLSLHARR